MKVIKVEPGMLGRVVEINPGLESLQSEVEGCIEAVYPWDDPVAIICDEEGKINGKNANRVLRDDNGEVYDVICGTFLVVGVGAEDFTSIPEELIQKYMERFGKFETMMRMPNGKVMVINED